MSDLFDIGVTGTRHAVTDFQQKRLLELLVFLEGKGAAALHHGDCVGADDLAHTLAHRVGIKHIIVHPPLDHVHRAFCDIHGPVPSLGISVCERRPYLTRNRDIVEASTVMIGVPKCDEIVRSGTWATIRYARQKQMTVYLIYPFRVETENDPFDWKPTDKFPNPWRRDG